MAVGVDARGQPYTKGTPQDHALRQRGQQQTAAQPYGLQHGSAGKPGAPAPGAGVCGPAQALHQARRPQGRVVVQDRVEDGLALGQLGQPQDRDPAAVGLQREGERRLSQHGIGRRGGVVGVGGEAHPAPVVPVGQQRRVVPATGQAGHQQVQVAVLAGNLDGQPEDVGQRARQGHALRQAHQHVVPPFVQGGDAERRVRVDLQGAREELTHGVQRSALPEVRDRRHLGRLPINSAMSPDYRNDRFHLV